MSVFAPGLVQRSRSFDSKADCLKQMVSWLHSAGAIASPRAFLKDVNEREEVMPTGIGRAVALPHARSESALWMQVAVCTLEQPLDWHSLDGKPVRIVLLVAVPQDAGKDYMQFMQRVSEFCRHEENRKALLLAESDDAMLSALRHMETDKR